MNEALRDLGDYIDAALGKNLLAVEVVYDQLNLHVTRSSIVKVLTLLRIPSPFFSGVTVMVGHGEATDKPKRVVSCGMWARL
jgi:hypothetical protein